jgi:hypothetical protein
MPLGTNSGFRTSGDSRTMIVTGAEEERAVVMSFALPGGSPIGLAK